jgi:glycine cleavage system H lipoate-binding protein
MTVLLVLATFIVFLTIDWFYSRKRVPAPVMQFAPAELPQRRPEVVAGFRLPENLRYHFGHTWALAEGPKHVRIGMDDLAARLIGAADRITLPRRGQWVRQGQKIWSIERAGRKTEMVSPVEGMITDINEAALRDPQLALRDPYGEGWLVMLHSPDAPTNFRNLLGGSIAHKWLEEAAERLRAAVPAMAGAYAQDGGLMLSDLSEHLPEKAWSDLAREFFLS